MANKGGGYEREVCRRLTRWWTGGPEADVLWWRTSQSGGRATSRSRAGKKTGKAHVGDITAIEPEGRFWSDLVTMEAKRGYREATLSQVLDLPFSVRGQQPLHSFLDQTLCAQERAGTPFWTLVHRRDRCEALIYFSSELFAELVDEGCFGVPRPTPFLRCEIHIRRTGHAKPQQVRFVVMQLEDFLDEVTPGVIRAVHARFF